MIESDDFLTFKCGGASRLVVTRSSTGTPRVADQGIVASRAISRRRWPNCAPTACEVEEFDEPGLKTVDGIADVGFALAAWFIDPHGNSIGLLQFKETAT